MDQVKVVTKAADDEPVTADEIAEYREMRPILRQMVQDWQVLRGPTGCPAMRHILAPK